MKTIKNAVLTTQKSTEAASSFSTTTTTTAPAPVAEAAATSAGHNTYAVPWDLKDNNLLSDLMNKNVETVATAEDGKHQRQRQPGFYTCKYAYRYVVIVVVAFVLAVVVILDELYLISFRLL